MASLVAANFLQILPAFPIGTFTHFSHLSHFLYPPSISRAWEIAPAASPGLCGCLNAKCQSRRPWMTPTIVCVLMSSPSSCALHTASLTLVTSLHCVYLPRKDYVAMGEDSWQPWPPQLLMGPDEALSPVTGLQHCDHL